MKAQKSNSGYTLLELMVVMAFGLVVPSVAHGFGNMQLRTAAGSVSNLMAQARIHAVYESRHYMIVFGPASETERALYLVRDDGKQTQHVTLPPHLALRAANAQHEWSDEPQPLHFFADGTSQFAQLDLVGDRGRHVQVALDPLTARVRVSQIYDAAEEQQ